MPQPTRRHLLFLALIGGATAAYGLRARVRKVRVAPVGGEAASPAEAITAITDATAASPYEIDVAPGRYGEVGWHTTDHVDIIGRDRAACVLAGELPNDASAQAITRTSTVWLDTTTTLQDLTITARNLRYAVHLETGGRKPDATHRLIGCTIEHGGNDAAIHNDWWSQFAVGSGLSSGADVLIRDCVLRAPKCALSYHTNTGFARPSRVAIEDTLLAAAQPGGTALRIMPLGSGQPDTCRLTRTRLAGDIVYWPDPWLATELARQPADHAEIAVVGAGNSPAVFVNRDFGQALAITSARDGPASSIAVSGDAVPLLFGDGAHPKVVVRAASPGLPGRVHGWGDISGVPVGPDRTVAITSLGRRLGDRRASPRSLTVAVDGDAPVAIRFDADYRDWTNAAVIALLQRVLGPRAVVGTHAPGARYRPRFVDEEQTLHNMGERAILMGMAVAHEGSGVRAMTVGDPSVRFAGIAWEDVPVGRGGRVKHRGLLPVGDLLGVPPGVLATGDTFSIDPARPGWLRRGGDQGLLRAVRGDAVRVS